MRGKGLNRRGTKQPCPLDLMILVVRVRNSLCFEATFCRIGGSGSEYFYFRIHACIMKEGKYAALHSAKKELVQHFYYYCDIYM